MVDFVEGFGPSCIVLERGHELKLHSVASNVIKHELSLSTNGMYATSDIDNFVILTRSWLCNRIKFGHEIGETVRNLEFVRVGISTGGFDVFDLSFAVGLVLRRIEILVVGGILFRLGGSIRIILRRLIIKIMV
jgi:hypothetical protein